MSTVSRPSTPPPSWGAEKDINDFQKSLWKSKRILALCGAGLSASSGLATFRGKGGLWKNHKPETLTTREAFKANPGLVWQFYAWRRAAALKAKPNEGHIALAKLAKKKQDFVCLTQNVDGLSPRTKHPMDRLHQLHGTLMDIKCFNLECDYIEKDNIKENLCPALAIEPQELEKEMSSMIKQGKEEEPNEKEKTLWKEGKERQQALVDILVTLYPPEIPSIPSTDSDYIDPKDLPHCPKCNSLLRPGIVWFGESLDKDIINHIDDCLDEDKKVDIILVIGTTAKVYPAAGFVAAAKSKGARVAVINTEARDLGGVDVIRTGEDWMFEGDAAEILPVLFQGVLEN